MRSGALYLGAAMSLVVSGVLHTSLDAQTPPVAQTACEGVYTQTQAARGGAVYQDHCAACHGSGLEGADVNPPLAGAGFLANWQGQTARDLTTRIRATMPPDNPGRLGAAETADITAYLLMRNRFPDGSAELPRTAQLQTRIQIIACR